MDFKETISFHYMNSYDEILKTLLSSPVLYADETVANLRSESGYVWCITDGRSVYYFYKDSREGSFLPEMLKDFRGVLVSDFFAAYDLVPCRQQRCLVHLMRDFNEEIKNHPFDDELKLLAAEFSAVVKSMVETIDARQLLRPRLRLRLRRPRFRRRPARFRQFRRRPRRHLPDAGSDTHANARSHATADARADARDRRQLLDLRRAERGQVADRGGGSVVGQRLPAGSDR